MPPVKSTRVSQVELKEDALQKLKKLLLTSIAYEEKIDVLRMFLVSNEIFDCYGGFCRLDRNEDGFITPLDMVDFFRDNGITDVTEAECYFIIKYFDSDVDGKLHFTDFMQVLLPCGPGSEEMRSDVTQRVASGCKPDEFLTVDVEQDLSRLLKMEVDFHREVELLKQ